MSGFYDDSGDDKTVKKTIVMAILAASLVFLAFLLLLYERTKPDEKKKADAAVEEQTQEEENLEIGKSNLTSKDMDFWDMFRSPEERDDTDGTRRDDTEGKPAVFTEQGPRPDKIKEDTEDAAGDSNWERGNPNDGTHISITDESGNKTWYELLDIPKSTYSATFVKKTDNGMVKYDGNGKQSAAGIDLNNSCSVADLSALKEAGITFVMLRSISRNPGSGVITPDESFANFAALAQKEELPIGVYADSAAVTEEEAVEEANYAIASAQSVSAKYPVAISLADLSDQDARMGKLSNVQRTKIVKAFCDQVRSFGLKPMIRGRKEDLITKLNLEDLTAYDIWVEDQGTESDGHPYFTDYPYVFTIWRYGNGSQMQPATVNAGLDLSFVNYEQN